MFHSKYQNTDLYINFIKLLELKEEEKTNFPNNEKFVKVFFLFLISLKSQESYYILQKLVQQNLITIKSFKDSYKLEQSYKWIQTEYEAEIDKKIIKYYCVYHFYNENEYELLKNDPELHKKLIQEGVNPNEIAKIIRNDKIEKLQEISSQTNFDFYQFIESSLYERCSFIDGQLYYVTLIDYAAFFSAVKCFKYLLMNGANVEYTGRYAVAGGNEEIIHLCEQNHVSFEDAYEVAIQFHRNDIFKYLYENKFIVIENLTEVGIKCIKFSNYELLSFILHEGMEINESIIDVCASVRNIFLVFQFLFGKQIPKNILAYSARLTNYKFFKYLLEQEGIDINAKDINGNTALILASQNGHTEIVKLLLEQNGIGINAKNDNGETALIHASANGFREIVKLLLEQEGIDINIKENSGFTALMRATQKGHSKIIKFLLEKEGILNVRNISLYDQSKYLVIYLKKQYKKDIMN